MMENEFISLGRPMKGAFIYIIVVILLTLIGAVCVTAKGSVVALVLGIIFFVFAVAALINYILIKKMLSKYENIVVHNGIFVISPINSIDQIELYADDITSIDFFVLPILNDGSKDSSNFNNQVRINTIDDKFIVYCSNKKEFKEYIEKTMPEKMA